MQGTPNSQQNEDNPYESSNNTSYDHIKKIRCKFPKHLIFKFHLPRQEPRKLEYRSYKHFDNDNFKKDVDFIPHSACEVWKTQVTITGSIIPFSPRYLMSMHS